MWNLIETFKGHWTNYLVKFPFDWGVTLTFKYPVKKEHANIKLKAWTRKLIREEKLQIGYIAVINEITRIHLHLLVLGRNRHGKTLLDVPVDKWKKEWNAHSKIRLVEDIEKASSYLSSNLIVRNEDLSDVWTYNSKLLNKLRLKEDLTKLNDITSWGLNKSHSDANVDKKQIRSQMTELMNSFKDTEGVSS